MPRRIHATASSPLVSRLLLEVGEYEEGPGAGADLEGAVNGVPVLDAVPDDEDEEAERERAARGRLDGRDELAERSERDAEDEEAAAAGAANGPMKEGPRERWRTTSSSVKVRAALAAQVAANSSGTSRM